MHNNIMAYVRLTHLNIKPSIPVVYVFCSWDEQKHGLIVRIIFYISILSTNTDINLKKIRMYLKTFLSKLLVYEYRYF